MAKAKVTYEFVVVANYTGEGTGAMGEACKNVLSIIKDTLEGKKRKALLSAECVELIGDYDEQ